MDLPKGSLVLLILFNELSFVLLFKDDLGWLWLDWQILSIKLSLDFLQQLLVLEGVVHVFLEGCGWSRG